MQFYVFNFNYIYNFYIKLHGLNVLIKISAEWIKINACYKTYTLNIKNTKR